MEYVLEDGNCNEWSQWTLLSLTHFPSNHVLLQFISNFSSVICFVLSGNSRNVLCTNVSVFKFALSHTYPDSLINQEGDLDTESEDSDFEREIVRKNLYQMRVVKRSESESSVGNMSKLSTIAMSVD